MFASPCDGRRRASLGAMTTHSTEANPERSVGAAANTRLPSTNWEWRRVKVRRPAGGQGDSAAKPLRWFHLPPWPTRRPLSITVLYRGGPEAWYEIRARGTAGRFPGHVALHDALAEVYASRRD